MGTTGHLIVEGDERLLHAARARVEQLEQRWSRFVPTSEVSRLNARRGRPVRVSSDTLALVRAAVEGWQATAGRFDPTVLGDVVRAGYDDTFSVVAVRGGRGVSLLRRNCAAITWDEAAGTVTLPDDAGFDPGGIGKGLAADMVVGELLAMGAAGACVNLGGDLRVEGEHESGCWVVAVEDPASDRPIVNVGLRAGGVSTSTVVKRSWWVDGRRVHHVIDPSTGEPAGPGPVSVTALAGTAAGAEVAATAALLVPIAGALDAIRQLGCEGLVTDAAGGHRATDGFDAFMLSEARR